MNSPGSMTYDPADDSRKSGHSKKAVDQARVRELFEYAADTGELRWKSRPRSDFKTKRSCAIWNARYSGNIAGSVHPRAGYALVSIDNIHHRVHRLIWLLVHGSIAAFIDHINGDRADNRLCNLRAVSRQENQRNLSLPRNNTSGVMGVHRIKADGYWMASIRANGRSIHLGRFADKDSAIAARKAAEAEYGFHPNHGRGA